MAEVLLKRVPLSGSMRENLGSSSLRACDGLAYIGKDEVE
jgi:hypothetical protein